MRVPQSIRNKRIRNELIDLPGSYDLSGNIVTMREKPIRLRLDLQHKQVIELSLDLFSSWIPNSIEMKILMPLMTYPFEPPTVKIFNSSLKSGKIHKKLMETKGITIEAAPKYEINEVVNVSVSGERGKVVERTKVGPTYEYKVERYNQETHKLETISGGRQNANKPNVERQRADKVREILTSDAWQSLELASA